MKIHMLISVVSAWAIIYALAVAQWREAFILQLVFTVNIFLAGTRKT